MPNTLDQLWWGGVPSQWPRRLLHVPTLTSIERDSANSYASVKEPPYNILTYTWGRWAVKQGPTISIKGITWKIPAISEHHFTVSSLEQVLRQIASDTEYVWIDIACIDQANDAVKADEVGRQAGIFKQARKVYAWLNWHPPKVLRECIHVMNDECYNIINSPWIATPPETVCSIDAAINALDILFKDPWFSSLWTLQESFLRRDAMLINRETEFITLDWTEKTFAQLRTIASVTNSIHETLSHLEDTNVLHEIVGGPEGMLKVRHLKSLIENSGLSSLYTNNPNLQYRASRFRQVSREVDGIYAIMQMFNLRLGQSLEPDREFTIDELYLQFVTSLNLQSPVQAQAFVHSIVPGPGESYRISSQIKVPPRLHHVGDFDGECEISVRRKDQAFFVGKACDFESLLDYWDIKGLETGKDFRNEEPGAQSIFLDASDYSESLPIASADWPSMWTRTDTELAEVKMFGHSIMQHFGKQNLRVLLVGQQSYDRRRGRKQREETPEQSLAWRTKLGLLLLANDAPHAERKWRRLGVCVWSLPWRGAMDENCWQKLEGEFG